VSQDFLGERRQALVDEFFKREEAKKLDQYKAALAQQRNREELQRASGIKDADLLNHLISIGFSADTLAAIALVPLVHVAWADGKVQAKEREAILKAAAAKGIGKEDPAAQMLSAWLNESGREPTELFATWKQYVSSLAAALKPEQLIKLEQQITGFAREVASAAGGFLGIRSISQAEERALNDIQAVFKPR
jgi:uncharacterized tellurite resistance protein B-like protein